MTCSISSLPLLGWAFPLYHVPAPPGSYEAAFVRCSNFLPLSVAGEELEHLNQPVRKSTMELQLDVSDAPFPHTLGLIPEVLSSFSVLFQYSGRGRGMCEKQEGLGPMHMPPSACVPILLPGGQDHLPEDPAGVSKEAQHAGLPLRSCIEKGPGPTTKLGGWLRRYGQG